MSNDSYTPGAHAQMGTVAPGSGGEAVNWTDIQQWESAPLQTYAVECENKQRLLQAAGDSLQINWVASLVQAKRSRPPRSRCTSA